MTATVKNVLIIGGGFSGMSAAIEFTKRGVAVDLVEIDAGWRSYGAGISLGGATLRAFRTLGILDDFLARGNAADGVDLCTPQGELISQIPTPRIAGADVPGGGAIMRPALAEIMAAATRRAGVNVRLGCSFKSLTAHADGVEATLTDGSASLYDLVVGADGLNSKVRQWLFPMAAKPRYTGQGVWRAVLTRPAGVERARMWMGGAVKPGINLVSKTHMYLFLTEQRPTNDHVPVDQQPAVFRDLLAPFPDALLQTLREQISEHAQIVYRPLERLLLPKPWFAGRTVLIGDAVHATTPHLASGACIGIEDGIVLAEELSNTGSVTEGLNRFQDRRWERCRMVVENSSQLGELEITGGDKAEHARIMRESMMALMQPI